MRPVVQNNANDNLNLRLLLVIGIISTLLLVEVVVVTQSYFQNSQEEQIVAEQIDQPSLALGEIIQEQRADLSSYRWVDREKQRVSIPIDKAISRYVEIERQRATTRPQ